MPQGLYKSLFLLILVGCSTQEAPKKSQHPVPVVVDTVKKQTVPIYIETIGNVSSPCVVDIRPQVGGTLLKSYVKQGQIVKKGELLYIIDPRPYQAALDKAKANLLKNEATAEFAKNRVKRFTDLVKKEFISKLTYDEYQKEQTTAESQVLNDRAEVALARINLEYCRICSPIDGRISQFHIYPGNVVSPNDQKALTVIRQISPICVEFTVPQRDLQHMQRFKCGEDLKIDVILPHEGGDGHTDDSYCGRVFFVDNHINQNTGTILMKGEVENEEHLLWPGEFVHVRMQLREKIDALMIPEAAVQIGQQGPFIFIVGDDMTVTLQPIILGEKVHDAFIVEDGVKENDQIVITGQLNLADGKKVAITNEKPPPKEENPVSAWKSRSEMKLPNMSVNQ